MTKYTIKSYQKGFEIDQIKIEIEATKDMAWPIAYTLEEFKKDYTRHDFDPDTRLFCFFKNKMVGSVLFSISPKNDDGIVEAFLYYPRVLPGYEETILLLIEQAIEVMKKKGVNIARTRANTMWESSFEILEKCGFKEHEVHKRGVKVYSVYDLEKGSLDVPTDSVEECTTDREFEKCAELATNWYNSPIDRVKNHMRELFTPEFTIAHLYVQEKNEFKAACAVAPNLTVKTIAAFYYIYAPEEKYLAPMVAKAISICIEKGYQTLVVDLINEHRKYEDFYSQLGFTKAAEWAYYERQVQ